MSVNMDYRQDLNRQMNKTLSKNEIISLIKAEKPFLKETFSVIHIGIFGSYAKNRQTIDSDIDFLVEFEEPRFDWIAGLNIYLEKNLTKKLKLSENGDCVILFPSL